MKQAQTPENYRKKSLWYWLWWFLGVMCFIFIALTGLAVYIYEAQLKPSDADEWSFDVQVQNYTLPLSIKKTLLWASNPYIAPWLNGFTKNSSHGQYEVQWDSAKQSLLLTCNQCENRFKGMGASGLTLEHVQVSIHQDKAENLSGTITLGRKDPVSLDWSGRFDDNALILEVSGKSIPIRHIYHALFPNMTELKKALITGTLDIKGSIKLPIATFFIDAIETNNFTVSGLDTQSLINVRSQCGPSSNLPMNHWMSRAVISAEDQRFEQHPGYDLEELMNAFEQNRDQGNIVRGGSTITQQTAKLLYTGSDRTLERKMKELLYAVEMEQTLGKARILQLYLDNAPWGLDKGGRFICGVNAAAKSYFSVPAKNLNPQQAVWLAAMLHSPVREAKNWQETGQINLDRAIWVANYVRNAPNSGPRGRQKIIDALRKDPTLGMTPKPTP